MTDSNKPDSIEYWMIKAAEDHLKEIQKTYLKDRGWKYAFKMWKNKRYQIVGFTLAEAIYEQRQFELKQAEKARVR